MSVNRTFYVSFLKGSDTNTGTAPEQAWKTIEKVNDQIFQPGDRVLFACGEKWHGMLSPRGDGAEFSPVLIGTFGDGEKPVIAGDGAYAAVYLKGVSHYRVNGLSVTNHSDERGIRQGICIMGKPEGITEDIIVENCEISDVTGENRRAMGPYRAMYWNGGIYVSFPGRTSEKNHLHGIVISNNYIHDVLTSGIRVNQMEDGLSDIHHTHVVVRKNRIERTGSDGIIVANCISPLIDRNTCLYAGALGTKEDTNVIAGVWVCATENALIQHNEVAYTALFENDGTAFDTDWGTSRDTVFQYNYTHDNGGGFFLDCMGIGGRNPECGKTILRYNVSLNDSRCLVQYDFGFPCEIYGNLFLNRSEAPGICEQGEGESHVFRENYFVFPKMPDRKWQASSFTGNFYSIALTPPAGDEKASRVIPEVILRVMETGEMTEKILSGIFRVISLRVN